MRGLKALNEGYSASEGRDVAFEDAFHELGGSGKGFTLATRKVGIHAWRLRHARIDGETDILRIIFRMLHNRNIRYTKLQKKLLTTKNLLLKNVKTVKKYTLIP